MSDEAKNAPKSPWLGVHFAVRVFAATVVLWVLLRQVADTNPIWAISSMIAVSDPQVHQAYLTFWGRIINGVVGCAVGLLFLAVGGSGEWKLPVAMAAAALISSYVVRVQVMYRQAPITAAIVIAGSLSHDSKLSGMEDGLKRVAEVMLGCVVGILVNWLISTIWPLAAPRSGSVAGQLAVGQPQAGCSNPSA
jgi:uncharacterized membrane protein YccC